MAQIKIMAISKANANGWREAIGDGGETYSIGPDKYTDAEIAAAVEAKEIEGELFVKGDKTYLGKPRGAGGGKGWTPRPQVPEWEKYASFATSYAAAHVIKPLIECQVMQKEAEKHSAKLTDLIALTHKSVSRSICDTMIELHKKCKEELGG